MVSILICSINPHYLEQVSRNVSETIGLPFEIIARDNRQSPKGICAVYNELAEKAQFPILLFLHEDVLFTTADWGNNLVAMLEHYSVVGLAGSSYKSRMYSGWQTGIKDEDAYHVTHLTNGRENLLHHHRTVPQPNYSVVCLDGVFIACNKKVWDKVKFNQELLSGFHLYDLDFSIRASLQGFQCGVTMEINLTHITSGGQFGDQWVEHIIKFHEAMQALLPYPATLNSSKELMIAKNWLDYLKNHAISFENRIKWIRNQNLASHPSLWYGIIKFMLYKPLRLSRIHQLFKGTKTLP